MSDRLTRGGDADALSYLAGKVGRGPLALVAVLMVLSSLTEGIGLLLLVPITQIVADQSVAGAGQSWGGPWGAALASLPLALLLAGFVALIALRAALMYAVLVRRTALSLGLVRDLRTTLHSAVIAADWRWLSGQRSADHAALIVSQAEQVGREADRALDLASSLVTLCGLIAAALWLAWPLTLATLGLGALTAIAWIALRRRDDALGEPFAAAYVALQSHVADGLTHLRAARIAGAEHALAREFSATAREIEGIERRYIAIGHRAHLALQVVAAAMLAILVWFGLRVLALPLALFVPVLAIFGRIVPLVGNMQEGWRAWRFCRPALDHLRRTVAEARAAAEPDVADSPPLRFSDSIVLDRVGFAFADRATPVLDGFSCTISAGSVVGISGPSGSGKSTLADLLSGLVAPDAGEIRVDGVALSGEQRIRWRRQIAYVEQVPYLFDGTIAANLAWGIAEPDRAAMAAALRDASAEFVLRPAARSRHAGRRSRPCTVRRRAPANLARASAAAAPLDGDPRRSYRRTRQRERSRHRAHARSPARHMHLHRAGSSASASCAGRSGHRASS